MSFKIADIRYIISMSYFVSDSTVRYSNEKGFGESYYIICPTCWNSGIRITRWEYSAEEISECAVCERMIRTLNDED